MKNNYKVKLPAIEIEQTTGRKIYSFAADGKIISSFASISRVKRESNSNLTGYQRPEILSHISEIKNYIESESPLIPNAIVIAFDSSVEFEPTSDCCVYESNYSRTGILSIPIDPDCESNQKPGFIVDGQQRIAAVREADIESFPICITAFITDDIKEQIEQFILVNSTKPLPKGLIYELLPQTETALSTQLQKKRLPAILTDLLNYREDSALNGMIHTPTNPAGVIKDNSILRMLDNSLSDGVLFKFRDSENKADIESMMSVLNNFWGAVKEVFAEAWNLPPKQSRLTHGAGIISLGLIMDAISERYRNILIPSLDQFIEDLMPLKEICRWTNGFWEFSFDQQRRWSEIQNTPKDIDLLSNYLLFNYKKLVWSTKSKQAREIIYL